MYLSLLQHSLSYITLGKWKTAVLIKVETWKTFPGLYPDAAIGFNFWGLETLLSLKLQVDGEMASHFLRIVPYTVYVWYVLFLFFPISQEVRLIYLQTRKFNW